MQKAAINPKRICITWKSHFVIQYEMFENRKEREHNKWIQKEVTWITSELSQTQLRLSHEGLNGNCIHRILFTEKQPNKKRIKYEFKELRKFIMNWSHAKEES